MSEEHRVPPEAEPPAVGQPVPDEPPAGDPGRIGKRPERPPHTPPPPDPDEIERSVKDA